MRIYRQPSSQAPRRGRIALGVVAVTAALAFGIAVFTLTAGELLAGGSIGDGARRTTFGGGPSKAKSDRQPAETEQERPTDTEQDETTPTQPESPSDEDPEPVEPTATQPPSTSPEATTPQAPPAQPPAQTPPAP